LLGAARGALLDPVALRGCLLARRLRDGVAGLPHGCCCLPKACSSFACSAVVLIAALRTRVLEASARVVRSARALSRVAGGHHAREEMLEAGEQLYAAPRRDGRKLALNAGICTGYGKGWHCALRAVRFCTSPRWLARTGVISCYSLQFSQTVFAALRLDTLQVRRGLGHGVLMATLRAHNQAPSAPRLPHLIHISGEIRNSAADHIAEVRPVTFRWWANRPDDTLYLHAPVSYRALSMLTDVRNSTNEAVQITFALTPNIEGREDWQTQTVEIMHRVAASDWLSLLDQSRHTSFHVVEVPLEGIPVPDGLTGASDRFRAAIRHLELCQWDDAIAECRQVIEDLGRSIGPAENMPPWAQYADQHKTGWSFTERCAAIRALLRHATHEAHHGGPNSLQVRPGTSWILPAWR